MSVNQINPGGSMATAAAQLFKASDTNGDNQISANEFLNLLSRLASLVTGSNTGRLDGPLATQPILTAPQADTAPKVYQTMVGFDTGKLNDPTHTTAKYVFARATQDLGLPSGDRAAMSVKLPDVVDYAKSHGYPNAKQVDDDEIDFGDSFGSVDVITSWGQWWWGPKS